MIHNLFQDLVSMSNCSTVLRRYAENLSIEEAYIYLNAVITGQNHEADVLFLACVWTQKQFSLLATNSTNEIWLGYCPSQCL